MFAPDWLPVPVDQRAVYFEVSAVVVGIATLSFVGWAIAGTLTRGEPVVTDVVILGGAFDETAVMRLAAGAMALSSLSVITNSATLKPFKMERPDDEE